MKKYSMKKINSMILYLRLNNLAQFQSIENEGQIEIYDYISDKKFSLKEISDLAIKNGWKENWNR